MEVDHLLVWVRTVFSEAVAVVVAAGVVGIVVDECAVWVEEDRLKGVCMKHLFAWWVVLLFLVCLWPVLGEGVLKSGMSE